MRATASSVRTRPKQGRGVRWGRGCPTAALPVMPVGGVRCGAVPLSAAATLARRGGVASRGISPQRTSHAGRRWGVSWGGCPPLPTAYEARGGRTSWSDYLLHNQPAWQGEEGEGVAPRPARHDHWRLAPRQRLPLPPLSHDGRCVVCPRHTSSPPPCHHDRQGACVAVSMSRGECPRHAARLTTGSRTVDYPPPPHRHATSRGRERSKRVPFPGLSPACIPTSAAWLGIMMHAVDGCPARPQDHRRDAHRLGRGGRGATPGSWRVGAVLMRRWCSCS